MRSKELQDATTSAIFEYVSDMMFENHQRLFAFLLAICRIFKGENIINCKEFKIFINGVEDHVEDEGGKKNTDINAQSTPFFLDDKV